MEQSGTPMRAVLAIVVLLGVMLVTAYLQTIFEFSTYLALAVCVVDTIISAMILMGG